MHFGYSKCDNACIFPHFHTFKCMHFPGRHADWVSWWSETAWVCTSAKGACMSEYLFRYEMLLDQFGPWLTTFFSCAITSLCILSLSCFTVHSFQLFFLFFLIALLAVTNQTEEFKRVSKFSHFNTNNLWIRMSSIRSVLDNGSLHMEIIENKKVRREGGREIIESKRWGGREKKAYHFLSNERMFRRNRILDFCCHENDWLLPFCDPSIPFIHYRFWRTAHK